MNAPEHLRRGACPGLSAPMQTGDGLLARLTPMRLDIALDAFAGLCAAARGARQRHRRDHLARQHPGARPARRRRRRCSPPRSRRSRIEASDGIPVLTDPLSGDDALAAEIRAALAAASLATRLVGQGVGHRRSRSRRRHRVAQPSMTAPSMLRSLRRRSAPCRATACRRLRAAAARDAGRDGARLPHARRDRARRHRRIQVRHRRSSRRSAAAGAASRRRADRRPSTASACARHRPAVRPFRRRHADRAWSTRRAQAGAAGVRPAPGRALLLMGLSSAAAATVAAEAKALGFIVDPADPRRRIVACAGAPICALRRNSRARAGAASDRRRRKSAEWRDHPSLRLHQRLRPSGARAGCRGRPRRPMRHRHRRQRRPAR